MDPRIAVSAVSTLRWTLDEDLAFWAEAGVEHVGVSMRKLADAGLPESARRVTAAGLRVSSVGEIGWFLPARPEKWGRHRDRLRSALEVAVAVGAPCLILVSGPAGVLEWESAAGALAEALAPVLDEARAAGVALALENTNAVRVDYSFVHTLRDAVDLAARLGTGVCMEVNACWAERGLAETVARGAGAIRLVQVGDYVVGSTCYPDRAVLGDGAIPFERIMGGLLAAGYRGPIEIELLGPRIEEEGYASAVRRSVAHLEQVLAALGPAPAG